MRIIRQLNIVLLVLLLNTHALKAGTPSEVLIEKIKAKIGKVNDYIADARLKTNVAFIKAPVGIVKVYYKKPDKLKIVKDRGLSILPQDVALSNPSTLLTIEDYDAIDAGEVVINNIRTRKIRILPRDINDDVVVMDVFIEESNLLLIKTIVTTKENGTFDMEMQYSKYKDYMLPDKLILNFNVKNYKMPKSISLDFDEQLSQEESEKLKNKKGTVEFTYSNYIINKGLDESIFK